MEWISVKDRLPEQNQLVIIYDTSNVYIAYYQSITFRGVISDNPKIDVTHWMPLPPKPIETTNK